MNLGGSHSSLLHPPPSFDDMSGLTYGAYGATTALTVVGLCKSLTVDMPEEAGANGDVQICCSMAKERHSMYDEHGIYVTGKNEIV